MGKIRQIMSADNISKLEVLVACITLLLSIGYSWTASQKAQAHTETMVTVLQEKIERNEKTIEEGRSRDDLIKEQLNLTNQLLARLDQNLVNLSEGLKEIKKEVRGR